MPPRRLLYPQFPGKLHILRIHRTHGPHAPVRARFLRARDGPGRRPDPSVRWPVRIRPMGRTVYGGGGIYPDVVLPEPEPAPVWLAQFRAFAAQQGHAVPEGTEADRALERMLLRELAGAKWGSAGYYRVSVALDEQIGAAVREFARAGQVLSGGR